MARSCSIVITARNRAHELQRTLQSICDQAYDVPIHVVDDASDDGTGDVLSASDFDSRGQDVALHRVDREGGYRKNPAPAYNLAHEKASGAKVIEQSAEVVHVTDCVTPLLKNCKRGRVALATVFNGTVASLERLRAAVADGSYAKSPDLRQFYGGRQDWIRYRRVTPVDQGFQQYCGALRPVPFFFLGAIHAKDFDAIGGYDESLAEHPDRDLAERLCADGIEWTWCGEAIAFHVQHAKR
ncbi:MAG: glycosyltransferase family 2 protein [Acidimicrobiia bacterium]|nr:glycosyltransferase family 2 protein [Acidimicrobiia bacterium]